MYIHVCVDAYVSITTTVAFNVGRLLKKTTLTIVQLYKQGLNYSKIMRRLHEEGYEVDRTTVMRAIIRYNRTGMYTLHSRATNDLLVTKEQHQFIGRYLQTLITGRKVTKRSIEKCVSSLISRLAMPLSLGTKMRMII